MLIPFQGKAGARICSAPRLFNLPGSIKSTEILASGVEPTLGEQSREMSLFSFARGLISAVVNWHSSSIQVSWNQEQAPCGNILGF